MVASWNAVELAMFFLLLPTATPLRHAYRCPPSMSSGPDDPYYWPARTHRAWTAEEDRLLWSRRGEDLAVVAVEMERGLGGVAARLDRLGDPESDAFRRLFGCKDDGGLSKSRKEHWLRPAKEAVQRIQHDPALSAGDFVIGYSDRVSGGVEQARLDRPNDCIKSSQRLFVNALPEHRIEWVKYAPTACTARLVWHKTLRFDAIFGTGRPRPDLAPEGSRIEFVVATHDEWARAKAANAQAAAEKAKVLLAGPECDERFEELTTLCQRLGAGDLTPPDFVRQATADTLLGRVADDAAPCAKDPAARLGAADVLCAWLAHTLPDEAADARDEAVALVHQWSGQQPDVGSTTHPPEPTNPKRARAQKRKRNRR